MRSTAVAVLALGHRQEKGDYRESWQPQAMSEAALAENSNLEILHFAVDRFRTLANVGLFVEDCAQHEQ